MAKTKNMNPEEFSEFLINQFLDIVKDLGMAKSCAELCVYRITLDADPQTLDWWKEVENHIKQY